MATLLHLDASVAPESHSASRAVTAVFRDNWLKEHPEGTVIYRDLAANPVAHLDGYGASAGFADPATHSPEQAAAFAERVKLVEELESADAVVIGAPMYNYTIPSTLKSWIDHVIIMGRTAGPAQSMKGIPLTVVASRGGSTAPGTPKERFEFVQNYLGIIFSDSMGFDLDFIVPELTLAPVNPAMAELVPAFEASRAKALEEAATKARAVAAAHAA